jgi:PAS domain S-box-containing protein
LPEQTEALEGVMNATDTPALDVRTSALLRIISAIETATTMDELLLLALSETAQLIGVPRSGIMLFREEGKNIQLVNTYPPRVSLPPAIALADVPYLDEIIEHRHSSQIYDVQDTPEQLPSPYVMEEAHLRSILTVPLVAQDNVIGVLLLATLNEPHHFSELEVSLVRILTGPLAAAISAFETTEAARRRSAELATLNDIANAITSSLDAREVYHLVVRQLNEYFRVDAGSLLMRDDETGDLEFVMTLEAGEEKLAGVRVPQGQGIVGHVAETQQYKIVPDVQHEPRYYARISEETGYDTRSILCVPMLIKGRTIGVIELLNKHDGSFTDEDAERLMRMASTIGVAIENARLFRQVATGRDRLEAILNANNDGILMADMRGVVVTSNPTAARLFQTTQEDLLGQYVDDLLNEMRERARLVTAPSWLNEDKDERRISEVIEFEIPGPRHRFIRHFVLPVHDSNHVEIGRLLLFQDISKERELSQLRDDLMGMLVHDLRAPLTAIMNGIMMVRRGLGGPVSDQQHELLTIAYQSSQTMLEMVNTLLDISKMEQGRMPLNYEPISPYTLVDEPVDRLRASAADNGVTLRQELPVGLPLIEADREKVVRMLQNLVDNAIKFSSEGDEVTLGVAHVQTDEQGVKHDKNSPVNTIPVKLPELPPNEWMIFWVNDQGIGIPAQYHNRIFEKFGQIRGRKSRGTGLGLTFCKLAAESHGGQIWLESEEQQGSTFALALPLTQEQENNHNH